MFTFGGKPGKESSEQHRSTNLCPHSLSVAGCRLGSLCKLTHVTDVVSSDSPLSSSTYGSDLGHHVIPLWWWRENTSCYTQQPNHWNVFPTQESTCLEEAFGRIGESAVVMSHRVDFKTMTMTHLSSGKKDCSRMIERVACLASPTWYTLSSDGKQAIQFDEETCVLIETVYCQGLKTRIQLRLGIHGLYLNLAAMEMRDPSTSSIRPLRRQVVRLNCSNAARTLYLVDEYGSSLYIFDSSDRAARINPRQAMVVPQGVLQTNELTRIVAVARCPVRKCKQWQRDVGHMFSVQHACQKGKSCPLALVDPALPADGQLEMWSDIHCSLFHHEGAPASEDDIMLQWKQNQTIAKQFRRKWVDTKSHSTSIHVNLKRVEPLAPEAVGLLELVSTRGLTLNDGFYNARIDRLQSPELWSAYLRLRQEIAESLFLGGTQYTPPPSALMEDIFFVIVDARDIRSVSEKGTGCLAQTIERNCTRVYVDVNDALDEFQGIKTKVILAVLVFVGWATRASETSRAVSPPVRLLTSKNLSRKECSIFDSCCDAQDQEDAKWFDIYDARQVYPLYVITYDATEEQKGVDGAAVVSPQPRRHSTRRGSFVERRNLLGDPSDEDPSNTVDSFEEVFSTSF